MDETQRQDVERASRILADALGTTVASQAEGLTQRPECCRKIIEHHERYRDALKEVAAELHKAPAKGK